MGQRVFVSEKDEGWNARKLFRMGRCAQWCISRLCVGPEWVDVLSGVSQGSVLGPLLFLIFVNDLPNWDSNSMRMFADETKIWRGIQVVGDSLSLEEDLHKLTKWSNKWLLRFNPEKCKVTHVGHNVRTEYHMMENEKMMKLGVTKEEKDSGIYTTNNLKPSMQYTKAALKATSVLDMIPQHFKTIDAEEFHILYDSYIRPHMEYCVQVCSPYLRKDIECLERV